MDSHFEEQPVENGGPNVRRRYSLKRQVVIGLSSLVGSCLLLAAFLIPMVQEARRVAVRSSDL